MFVTYKLGTLTRLKISRPKGSMWGYSYYAALLPRRGPDIASHSVCLSVCPSVPLSLPWVTSFRQPLASRMYFSARTEGIRTFRHALRAAYRTAISAAQILVIIKLTCSFLFQESANGRNQRIGDYLQAYMCAGCCTGLDK